MRRTNIVILVAIVLMATLGQDCDEPNYIIPTEPLDQAFDTTYDNIRSSQGLISYLASPSADNFVDYTITLLPAAAPLWALGAFTFLTFFICAMQKCCFDVCNRE